MNAFLKFFAPPAPVTPISGTPEELAATTRRWQTRITLAAMTGYALYYLVRKNLSVAMPAMEKELGITKADLGAFITAHGLIYGFSRFFNGWLSDRANARVFMTVGLLLCAAMCIGFGFSSAVLPLGLFWVANGWFQGMGFPPSARLMTHWHSPERLASRMGVWNTSHSIGAATTLALCSLLVGWNWRLCFFVPAAIAALGCAYLWVALRDTPPSVGLTEAPGTEGAIDGQRGMDWAFIRKIVFANPVIWVLGFANFFVYVVRYAALDWGPTMLKEFKKFPLEHGAWMIVVFEVCGGLGMLLFGWITDRIFGGRSARTSLVCMLGSALALLVFWKLPPGSGAMSTVLLGICGFFIYGPQALIGIAASNLGTKRAAATAAGLTGIFGYASTLLSGWGFGILADLKLWDVVLLIVTLSAALGAHMFALVWRARPHGYSQNTCNPKLEAQQAARL